MTATDEELKKVQQVGVEDAKKQLKSFNKDDAFKGFDSARFRS